MRPQKQAAADFIIDTVKKHPGEVTIVAIGSAANLAAALDKAPEIAPLAKRVVYMAGAFFCEGNVMPTSEFNEKYGGPQESPIDELNISLGIFRNYLALIDELLVDFNATKFHTGKHHWKD